MPITEYHSVIKFIHQRLQLLSIPVVFAIPKNDELLKFYLEKLGIKYFGGDENNVIQRVIDCAKHFNIEHIVDITCDCPLVSAAAVNSVINAYESSGFEYASNVYPERTWPDGLDIQVYNRGLLEKAKGNIKDDKHYSHTGWNITNQLLQSKCVNVTSEKNRGQIGLTLDEEEDLLVLYNLISGLNNVYGLNFQYEDIINYIDANPGVLDANKNVKRKVPGNG